MNLNFSQQIPSHFNNTSRLWIFQSSRIFQISESIELEGILDNFIKNWNSHGTPVNGFAKLFYKQFIIFMADETYTGVSGCSTDSMINLIKSIENKWKVQLFDRQALAFANKDKVQLISLTQFEKAIENNFISVDTLYFNNTVLTKEELLKNWIIPVKDSWLAKRLYFSEKP